MKNLILILMMLMISITVIGCGQKTEAVGGVQAVTGGLQAADGAAGATGTTGRTQPNTGDPTGASVSTRAGNETQDGRIAEEAAVKSLAEEFGKKLKMVSLLAPREQLIKSIQENYGGLVTPVLLEKWQEDPQNAPGRTVSSPWPERIDVQTVTRSEDGSYVIKGDIIEVTSVELENGGVAAKRPVILNAGKFDGKWLIASVSLGEYSDPSKNGSIVYENAQYGFSFALPTDWKGYRIVTDTWEGLVMDEKQGEIASVTGPAIAIRHPGWTEQVPRQDIPILIFTLEQWNSLQKDEFHIGAAPVGPSELGRNNAFVFALPARYNYAFPEGYQEVEEILNGNPLKTVNLSK